MDENLEHVNENFTVPEVTFTEFVLRYAVQSLMDLFWITTENE